MTSKKYLLWTILSVLLLSSASFATETEKNKPIITDVVLSSESFYVGEEFEISVLISGSTDVNAPETPEIDGLNLKLIQSTAVQKKKHSGFLIRYKAIAKRPGLFSFPPLELEVGNNLLTTDSKDIKILSPKNYPGLEIDVQLSKKEVYVGEAVVATFTWKSPLPFYDFRAVDIQLPFLNHHNFRVFDALGSKPPEDKAIGLPVSQRRIIAQRGRFRDNNKDYDYLTFKTVIVPQKAGPITLSPATLLSSYIPATIDQNRRQRWRPQYPSYFSNDFFSQVDNDRQFEKIFAISKPLTLQVKELPQLNRPENFSGVIGTLKVTTSADPVSLKTGDPLTLTITVSGHEFPQTIELPNINADQAFKRSFGMPPKHSSPRYRQNNKTFLHTLRPLRAGSLTIPPVAMNYFDPVKEKYIKATSSPIALTVKEAETITAFNAELADGSKIHNQLVINPQGIRQNSTADKALKSPVMTSQTLCLLILLVPPIAFLLFFILTTNRRLAYSDPQAYRSRQAFLAFRRSVNDQPEKAARQFFADHFGFAPGAHTFSDVRQRLPKNTDAEILQIIERLYQVKNISRFAPVNNATESISTREITRAIKALNKVIRHA